MRVDVRTPIRPTEDPEKVRQAVVRFLPAAEVVVAAGMAHATGDDLHPLRSRIWELRIIDTARGRLLGGADGTRLRFSISKQAALAGKVSFPATAHVLGDLVWDIHLEAGDPWKDAEALAWWICPETKDGEIVGPREI